MKRFSSIFFLSVTLVLNSGIILAQSNEKNISSLLLELQEFIKIDNESEIKNQKNIKYVPTSITEMLQLISEKNKRFMLFYSVEDELFLQEQYDKLALLLEEKTINDQEVKSRTKLLINFYELTNSVTSDWLNTCLLYTSPSPRDA